MCSVPKIVPAPVPSVDVSCSASSSSETSSEHNTRWQFIEEWGSLVDRPRSYSAKKRRRIYDEPQNFLNGLISPEALVPKSRPRLVPKTGTSDSKASKRTPKTVTSNSKTSKRTPEAVASTPKASSQTLKLQTPVPRISRNFKISLRPASEVEERLNPQISKTDGCYHLVHQDRIIDFVRFSRDVRLHEVLLPFEGLLEIKDQRYTSLRTVSSSTGEYLLEEPLALEALQFYRFYLTSASGGGSVSRCRAPLWQTHAGNLIAEWGHYTFVGGIDLWISL